MFMEANPTRMSLRKPRRNDGLPVFRTGMKSSIGERRGGGERTAAENASESTQKRLQRKPPVPIGAAAVAAAAAHTRVGAQSARNNGPRRDRVSPSRSARGATAPHTRYRDRDRDEDKAARLSAKGHQDSSDDWEGGVVDAGRGGSRGSDRKQLVRMLRQAVEEMDVLRREVASANQERAAWKQRDGDLSLTVSRLERLAREESDAAKAEAARARAAEARFARLLVWAREEERRRLRAEETLGKACEGGQAVEARAKALEEEARESKRLLDERRFKLEGALEDLRQRTSESERLEAQNLTMKGEAEALRELAEARGLEAKELRLKLAWLVEEAQGMSLENVKLRKQMSSEQERWRAAERSRVKQDERRRMEMDQKCDDLHTLRYRVQGLEARLSSETAMRQGAEEDARRSQEMERRSMTELLEGSKTRTGLAQSYDYPTPSHLYLSYRAPSSGAGGPAPATESAWQPWGSNGNGGETATTGAMTSGARSSTVSDVFRSCTRERREHGHDRPRRHPEGDGENWRWQDPVTGRTRDDPAATAGEIGPARSAAFLPPPLPLNHPPPLSVSPLRASLRGRGGRRSPSTAEGEPPLRPRGHARNPAAGLDGSCRRTERVRPRPQPRPPPSEDHCEGGGGEGGGR